MSHGFFSAASKDCRSDCCNFNRNGFVTRSKLQRGKFVFSKQPVQSICRLKSCRLYGKCIRNFEQHIKKEHNLMLAQHDELPPATLQQQYIATKTASAWMRYRKPEMCFVPGCPLGHQVYLTELPKHLRHEHSMSREEYREMMKNISLKDFRGHCPSMMEEIEESAMEQAAKIMGRTHHKMHLSLDPDDDSFPSLRLVHLLVIPDSVKYVSLREEEVHIKTLQNKNKGSISLIARKRFMSEEHKLVFIRSMSNDEPWVFPPDFSWIKYECAVCKHVHTLDIVFVNENNCTFFRKL